LPLGQELVGEIAQLARRERIVLFVGAGVNGGAGLTWKELLKQLLLRGIAGAVEPVPSADKRTKILAEIQREHDTYAQAGIAAILLGENRFTPELRNLIYSRLTQGDGLIRLEAMCAAAAKQPDVRMTELEGDETQQKNFGFLVSLARLCLRPEIGAVVTYNFDTLLELAMQMIADAAGAKRARQPLSISRQTELRGGQAGVDWLPVYHVHGCLPPAGTGTHQLNIPVVLRQEDFARSMQDPYAWEESSQLHFLRSHPGLFFGLSMSDWNILRLLHSAGRDSRPRRLHCVGASPDPLQRELKRRLLAGLGVTYHAAVGKSDKVYADVRGFADALYLELEGKS